MVGTIGGLKPKREAATVVNNQRLHGVVYIELWGQQLVFPGCKNTLWLSTVSECEASAMLPLECQYLNKNALTTLAGPLTPPVKHFQLKRKPKSATLRAELLQKCECLGHSDPALFSVEFSLQAPSPWNKDSETQNLFTNTLAAISFGSFSD